MNYNDASLIITPNGVKAVKLYALKGDDLNVVRATSATRVNASGLIELVGANVPRLDYSNGSCPSILVEPQRTNLKINSQQWASIGTVNITATNNQAISPDGTNNASKILPIDSGFHYIGDMTTVPNLNVVTASFYYKNFNHKNIGFYDNNTSGSQISINLENNTYTLDSNVINGGIINVGNGWYRAFITFIPSSTAIVNYLIFRSSTNAGDYVANGSYIYTYGWQIEQGSTLTSYIPTTSASVTRNADVISDSTITGITTITETFEDNTTNVITSPSSYTMSQGRIKSVVGV